MLSGEISPMHCEFPREELQDLGGLQVPVHPKLHGPLLPMHVVRLIFGIS